jgi:hypothetical protein
LIDDSVSKKGLPPALVTVDIPDRCEIGKGLSVRYAGIEGGGFSGAFENRNAIQRAVEWFEFVGSVFPHFNFT